MGIVINNPSSVDLTAPSTNIGTTTPPAIIAATLFRSANSGNVPFIAQPFGTGSIQAQQADSTATGGNTRGQQAVDLQMSRTAANQVASGNHSFAGGRNNIASGNHSVAIGLTNTAIGDGSVSLGYINYSSGLGSTSMGYACSSASIGDTSFGNSCSASGGNSTAIGSSNIANGESSIALGSNSSTKGVSSLLALGSNIVNVAGRFQASLLGLGVQTANATPTVLRSNQGAASTSNQLVLLNNSALTFRGLVIATITGAGDTSSWEIRGAIKRGANAASTALVGTPSVTLIAQDSGASAWVVAITADTTNGALCVTVTGESGRTIRWNCSITSSEVAF